MVVIKVGQSSFFDPLGKVIKRVGENDPESLDKYYERVVASLQAGTFVETTTV
ncbi:MAG TPA: hypothetical protein VFA81_05830 [Burkholderiales bacterium]|nr:hypothetical protein [Burkholderiales bacterium]